MTGVASGTRAESEVIKPTVEYDAITDEVRIGILCNSDSFVKTIFVVLGISVISQIYAIGSFSTSTLCSMDTTHKC